MLDRAHLRLLETDVWIPQLSSQHRWLKSFNRSHIITTTLSRGAWPKCPFGKPWSRFRSVTGLPTPSAWCRSPLRRWWHRVGFGVTSTSQRKRRTLWSRAIVTRTMMCWPTWPKFPWFAGHETVVGYLKCSVTRRLIPTFKTTASRYSRKSIMFPDTRLTTS